ncbi:protein NLRC3-like [Betta splendens]|uniref:Protein NLRC3-like n=1 Tax=Betta splendens TaxID=158456 RepID=A0A6P7M387_BETSP|nr:protein NLRC3-like [Betta splendens]
MDVSEKTEDKSGVLRRYQNQTGRERCQSRIVPMTFDGQQSEKMSQLDQNGPAPPPPSCVSIRSDRSKSEPIAFRGEQPNPKLSSEVSSNQPDWNLDNIFTVVEENVVNLVRNELKKLRKILDSEQPDKELKEDDEAMEVDDIRRNSNREAILTVTLNCLRMMRQEHLAESLHSKSRLARCQQKLKSNLKRKFQTLFEGTDESGNPIRLKEIYTELHVTQGENRAMNSQHEVRQIQAASWKSDRSHERILQCGDLFGSVPGRGEPIRTLVTKGVAGIGKTVLTQKFVLDWAEDRTGRDIHFIFPIAFHELNLLKEQNFSLVELLHHFFTETMEAGICKFEELQVLFIFDGLDESQLQLDFKTIEILTDVTKPASVVALITNIIRGKLLPSAQLWITTRPAAANQIPAACVDMVTEVRGFTDPQKEEYFRKRLRDEQQATTIISHIKSSRSLHVMCHIPVFCWITATVLEDLLETREGGELPKTLTELYIYFLVVQTKQGNVKYRGRAETDPVWSSESSGTVRALGRLAFETLEKNKLIFYEDELMVCGTDIKSVSVQSGLITEVWRGKRRLNENKVFCFVHLTIHEFLAALHVFLTFMETDVDLLRSKRLTLRIKSKTKHFYRTAVDRALESPTGHLDLFVRFLLGLSLENNQTPLQGLLKKTGTSPDVSGALVQYIKKKIRGSLPPERSINMFHCLNELDDHSLVEEMQQYLSSGGVTADKLSPSQWAALVFILLSSQKDLDVFDLKKFSGSEEGLQSLVPVVKASRKSLLSGCGLSPKSCDVLASVFTSKDSNLREVDLSNNDLGDTGVRLLSAGLGCPHSKLEVLRLSGCLVTEAGVDSLLLALSANPSHLKELDLSFNHPGDSSIQQLNARLKDPQWNLKTLNLDHCGECRLQPVPQRYLCSLSLDPNTANRNICLFDMNTRATVVVEKKPYPDHPERFDTWKQLLGSDGLTGRCYWELYWLGRVNVGVAYRGIRRSGDGDSCCLGWNDQSWSLMCSPNSFTAWHNNTVTDIDGPPPSECDRVGVYLDWSAGTLSFYSIPTSSNQLIELHTFHTTFTQPVYPAFGFGRMTNVRTDSKLLPCSIVLSQVKE